ncbi:MAG: hypothetical protein V2A73_22705 [Pseudomonadota bacterium]
MGIRELRDNELTAAAGCLHDACAEAARACGSYPPWTDASQAAALAAEYLELEPAGALVATTGGCLTGVGFVRHLGEAATIGPFAARIGSKGVGSSMLDELIARAEGWGCASIRLFLSSWNTRAFALCSTKGFAVVDVAAHVRRPCCPLPRFGAARGLEMVPYRSSDADEVLTLDRRLTGLERIPELERAVCLVARRRGSLVGFVARKDDFVGPALALDVSDLGILIAKALGDNAPAACRISTAAPTAMLAVLGLGFAVEEIVLVMSRGVLPPARPPQLYSPWPGVV